MRQVGSSWRVARGGPRRVIYCSRREHIQRRAEPNLHVFRPTDYAVNKAQTFVLFLRDSLINFFHVSVLSLFFFALSWLPSKPKKEAKFPRTWLQETSRLFAPCIGLTLIPATKKKKYKVTVMC